MYCLWAFSYKHITRFLQKYSKKTIANRGNRFNH